MRVLKTGLDGLKTGLWGPTRAVWATFLGVGKCVFMACLT